MPLGPDSSYSGSSRIYIKQQPAGTTLNGSVITTEEVIDAGGVTNQYGLAALNGVVVPNKVTIGAAKGSANVCVVTVTVCDNAGNAIANTPYDFDLILSDAATGIGVTATAPSASATITAGTQLNAYAANKAWYVQTNAAGQVVLTITDTAKTPYVVMAQTPGGVPAVLALTAASYGP